MALKSEIGNNAAQGTIMTETQFAQEDLQVDLTIHGFSANLIKEFAAKIVNPYFNGNLSRAVQILMEKAVVEESVVSRATNGASEI
jgi:hypothetical protein